MKRAQKPIRAARPSAQVADVKAALLALLADDSDVHAALRDWLRRDTRRGRLGPDLMGKVL
jgi:hypothetical protein